jgi:O-methyltransferase
MHDVGEGNYRVPIKRRRMRLGITAKKRIAGCVFPYYSVVLDKLNWNARWIATLKEAGDVPTFSSRERLHAFVHKEFCGSSPVDYMEFGVYQGASLRMWCQANTHPDSRFFGFDSFEGLPEDWSPAHPKGTFTTLGKLPQIADSRVQFVVGWYQRSLSGFLAEYRPKGNQIIIHNDSDLYSSTLYCLTALDRIINQGTIIVFDEFDAVLDEYRALTSYSSAYTRTYKIVGATRGFRQVAVEITI